VAFYRRECSNITAIIHRFITAIIHRFMQSALAHTNKDALSGEIITLRRFMASLAYISRRCPVVQRKTVCAVQRSRHLGHSYQADIMTYITSEVGLAKGDAPVTCSGSSTDYKSWKCL